ncbi:MAG: hypothetical protein ACI4PF_06560 [Christensenellales bacterium]
MFKDIQECYKYLIDIGLLISCEELEPLYHGRTRRDGETEEWQVDPKYNNGGNATGNRNVNSISTLYLASKDIANDFAEARARKSGGVPEVHELQFYDKKALLFNRVFSFEGLSEEEKSKVYSALKELSVGSVTEFAPVDFKFREMAVSVIDVLKRVQSGRRVLLLREEDIDEAIRILQQSRIPFDKDLVKQLAESYNTKALITRYPNVVFKNFMEGDSVVATTTGDININLDWVASWFANNHIIGSRAPVKSATLHRNIMTYAIFDKEKINTRKVVGDKLHSLMGAYGSVGELVEDFSSNKEMLDTFLTSSPKETMDYIRTNPTCSQLMDMKSGVWEGYTVGEHTEAVLKVLEDSFEGDVPDSLMPFLKMVVLSHDIGKGLATSYGQKERHSDYTMQILPNFHKAFGVSDEASQLINFIVTETQSYTTRYYVGNDKNALKELEDKTRAFLSEWLNKNPSTRSLEKWLNNAPDVIRNKFLRRKTPTEGMVNGIMNIARVLQTCDSASYTQYATIRDANTGIRYSGGNKQWGKGFVVDEKDGGRLSVRFNQDADLGVGFNPEDDDVNGMG